MEVGCGVLPTWWTCDILTLNLNEGFATCCELRIAQCSRAFTHLLQHRRIISINSAYLSEKTNQVKACANNQQPFSASISRVGKDYQVFSQNMAIINKLELSCSVSVAGARDTSVLNSCSVKIGQPQDIHYSKHKTCLYMQRMTIDCFP